MFTLFQICSLFQFPGLFSAGLVTKEGPTRADVNIEEKKRIFYINLNSQCEQATFKMTFVTHTEDKQKTIHEFTGPDPGYLGTSTILIGCVIMLLKENDRLPVK